jgi:hypothetical protein
MLNFATQSESLSKVALHAQTSVPLRLIPRHSALVRSAYSQWQALPGLLPLNLHT